MFIKEFTIYFDFIQAAKSRFNLIRLIMYKVLGNDCYYN